MNHSQSAVKEYRTWMLDSNRWSHYRARPDDIIIATYPKCGTTWMQRIVASLIFQSSKPLPLTEVSPWVDRRFRLSAEKTAALLEAQKHRRFLKSHLPFDGLPIYDDVRYIHVARDGRDAVMSWHNHVNNMQPSIISWLDKIGLNDEAIARPFPNLYESPVDEFRRWLREPAIHEQSDGSPNLSYFEFEKSWWDERHRDNVLLVHFNDLKSDLAGEIKRVAQFLEIGVADELMSQLVDAATFSSMKRNAVDLVPGFERVFEGGARGFLNKGTNRRWLGVYQQEDLDLFEQKLKTTLTGDCAGWLEHGGTYR